MFIRTYAGDVAVDQITLIETQDETPTGTPFHVIHYRHGTEIRVTKAHPDYVRSILQADPS